MGSGEGKRAVVLYIPSFSMPIFDLPVGAFVNNSYSGIPLDQLSLKRDDMTASGRTPCLVSTQSTTPHLHNARTQVMPIRARP